jgi:hypothetical protein
MSTRLSHLFERAEREHPDLMEPYSARLAEAVTSIEKIEVMRAGLRETFRRRNPMPDEFWPKQQPGTSA